MYPDLNTWSQGFFNLVPRPISVSGNKAAGREACVKNSNRASSAAESQKRAMKCHSAELLLSSYVFYKRVQFSIVYTAP